ncbi:MAG: PhoX family phosphatase [Aquabacterium sp.]|uniref:PhoX family protein n=1 Tax=Aquabacterium sp. TaxID=1872578 RepID=UPI0025C51D81|nr:PhoX family phosphatase [Aquabacterium sp.]MBI5925270.1 PhoX family phosphatase [Aquabacterium sp.]
MKGASHPTNDVSLNPSSTPSILEVISEVQAGRRQFIKSGLSATALASAGGLTLGGLVNTVHAAVSSSAMTQPIGFANVPANTRALNVSLGGAADAVVDKITVPTGYTAQVLVAWGDPIMAGGTAFVGDASESAAQQARQYGMHTDGMHFFPMQGAGGTVLSDRGILCANNEYTHEHILFPGGQDGGAGYDITKTRKSQAAHGVSVLEVRRVSGSWKVVKNSIYGRRVTANTLCKVSGPAAGHALLKSKKYAIAESGSTDTGLLNDGTVAYGTINNCAHGYTPWGTYLTCEENWNGNFGSTTAVPSASSGEVGKLFNRYGVTASGFGYRWHTTDQRFDVNVNPNEPNLFGWVVEIDPTNPIAAPIKRTALGRFKHESAQYVVDADNNIAFYMGDDERNEYVYKFVCAGKYNPTNRAANRNLLDSGTLYVAKFNSTLSGEWIALVPGTVGVDGVALRDNPNFLGANDAEVLAKILIKARMAGDAVGATMMDRPEWTGARPRIAGYDEVEIYCTLTNNNRRGSAATATSNAVNGSTTAGSARPAPDAANPRPDNVYGHIIRWRETGKTVTATTFAWDLFAQAGDTSTAKSAKTYGSAINDYKGDINDIPNGSADYGAPDGLWFDWFGRLWVQTDQVGNGSGDFVNIGGNMMVCADPTTGETRRFLTGPNKCEVTGVTMTPDGKTMFVGVQHPGEDNDTAPFQTIATPTYYSTWPQGQWAVESDGVTPLPAGRPRSAVVVITKDDGGIIGS